MALFFAVFSLLLLSAIAATLILSSSTDTSINWNYRSEEVAYFGAKSGIEEVRDRMMTSNPNGAIPLASLPTTATSPLLYVLNEGNQAGTVKPWLLTNAYKDDELCHDGYTLAGLTVVSADQPCTTVPSGGTWYNTYALTTASNTPWAGTAAALPYKWVRLGLKLDGSVQNYLTDNLAANKGNLVCWNGTAEEVLTTAQPQSTANCATGFAAPAGPVYLLTALGIAPNGARKMLQAEIALTPNPSFPYGFWANSNACPAITFSGNGTTDSYSTAGYTSANASSAYGATNALTGGDIGSNGSSSLSGNATIGGSIGAPNTNTGNCPAGLKTSGNAGMAKNQTPPNQLIAVPNTILPAPPAPNPLPPNTSCPTNCYSANSSTSIVPGTFGNINVSGNAKLTFAPGTYNINSLSLSGNGVITISPSSGSVIFNIAGTGQATVFDIFGNGLSNPSNIPNNMLVNYAGSGAISVSGNGQYYGVVNAPNAAVTYSGNGAFFGAITGNTITDSGNGSFHYDTNPLRHLRVAALTLISYREVSY